jgi:hypothetical protein
MVLRFIHVDYTITFSHSIVFQYTDIPHFKQNSFTRWVDWTVDYLQVWPIRIMPLGTFMFNSLDTFHFSRDIPKKRSCIVLHSTSKVWEFQFLHILINIWYCLSFNYSYYSMRYIFIVPLICLSLMTQMLKILPCAF